MTFAEKARQQLARAIRTGSLLLLAACTDASTANQANPVRIVTFGDSNTDVGYAGTDSTARAHSYVSNLPPRIPPDTPNDPLQLAGKIEAAWHALRPEDSILVINHGISGTTTGGGGHGGPDRHPLGSPNARTVVAGVTRFEAEALGLGYPWSGGETGVRFAAGPIVRTRAFVPGPRDFVYVSLGTNDPRNGMSSAETLGNLQWMIDAWLGAGLAPAHFIVTTLAPITGQGSDSIPVINRGILALASSGVHVIDLASYVSQRGRNGPPRPVVEYITEPFQPKQQTVAPL